jgi:predicted ATP-grasp superfamily ATP-dependent carboligase
LSRWQLPPQQIEVRTIKKVNLKGGTVIDGFPSGGLTNSIASTCFMRSIKNELVAVLDSPAFPPLAIIYDGTPNFPANICKRRHQTSHVLIRIKSGSVKSLQDLFKEPDLQSCYNYKVVAGR